MAATSHPLAVRAAVEMLDEGGSAADAAVAAVAVLNVVDPRSTGIGGDAFALYWPAGGLIPQGLAAAGVAASKLSIESLHEAGFESMPQEGAWTVTVPGSVSGWDALLSRYGRLDLQRVLEPAISLARGGFTVSPIVAEEWKSAAVKLTKNEESARVFLPSGRAPSAGEVFANPLLGEILAGIASEGPSSFYKGPLAERIAGAIAAAGGPLTADDLGSWGGAEWCEPIVGSYRDVSVFEIPPPGQGIAALMALGIYDNVEVVGPVDAEHAAIESMKLGFADARAFVGDPRFAEVPTAEMLSPAYLRSRSASIDMGRASVAEPGRPGDTVYVAVVDSDGNACSMIQSLYEGFGSGITVPGTGVVLQNRGANFVLDADHPNAAAPGKRPYHTIIPAMMGRDGDFLGCLGVVGGFMQPQGQMQILRKLVDEGASPAEAVSAPRWRVIEGRRVAFERAYDRGLVDGLADRGHEVEELGRFEAGGAQLILRKANGYVGASDPRKDGVAHA